MSVSAIGAGTVPFSQSAQPSPHRSHGHAPPISDMDAQSSSLFTAKGAAGKGGKVDLRV